MTSLTPPSPPHKTICRLTNCMRSTHYAGIFTRHALMGRLINRRMVGRIWYVNSPALRTTHNAVMTKYPSRWMMQCPPAAVQAALPVSLEHSAPVAEHAVRVRRSTERRMSGLGHVPPRLETVLRSWCQRRSSFVCSSTVAPGSPESR